MTAEQMADARALESAWDKIDNKVRFAKLAMGKELAIKFTLHELKMLQQFRRKFA